MSLLVVKNVRKKENYKLKENEGHVFHINYIILLFTCNEQDTCREENRNCFLFHCRRATDSVYFRYYSYFNANASLCVYAKLFK